MSKLITFENMKFGKLTVIEKDGEFFFIGKEVAEKLGYINPHKAIRNHIDSEDKRTERFVHPLGGVQATIIINESGLYSLILSSKLQQANDMYRNYTFTSDRSKLKVGMLVAVESSSSGSTAGLTYGHVGIYIGDGKVIDNIGHIRVTTLDDWIATFCKHHPVGYGFPPNVKGH